MSDTTSSGRMAVHAPGFQGDHEARGPLTRPLATTAANVPSQSNVHHLRRRASDRNERSLQGPLQLFLMRMLDEIDYAMVLLDTKGEIWHVNHLARAELGRGQLLHVDQSRLSTRVAGMQGKLQHAIQRAGQGTRSMLELRDADDSGTSLALVPMGHPTEALGGALPVLVITSRQTLCEDISLHFFAQSFGLTGAEKNVLSALSRGQEVQEIADDKKLAVSTVRTQVKQLRLKTRSGSIREVLGKLSTLPPVVSSIKAF